MDIVIGGMPRGGTTVAAKFYSLHEDIFCYAGETHFLPLIFNLVGTTPCIGAQVDVVANHIRHQLISTMVEMLRYSVKKGAHKRNLIFSEKTVDDMMPEVWSILNDGSTGQDLYGRALGVMRSAISSGTDRPVVGEKTPSNLFHMAEYGHLFEGTLSVAVVREPFGVLRSMRGRCVANDDYSGAFDGCIESNLGVYLAYARAVKRTLESKNSLLIQYEEMANDPAEVLRRMYGYWGREPDDRAVNFVENGNDTEVADRAPMFYKRLKLRSTSDLFTPDEIWKIATLTRSVRSELEYPDELLAGVGWDIPAEWSGHLAQSQVFALDGFLPPNEEGAMYLARRGSLVVYLKKARKHILDLKFWSEFPDYLKAEEVSLTLSINGKEIGRVFPGIGPQVSRFEYEFRDEDLQAMNAEDQYAIIKLESSHTFSPMATTVGGTSGVNRSVLLYDYSVISE